MTLNRDFSFSPSKESTLASSKTTISAPFCPFRTRSTEGLGAGPRKKMRAEPLARPRNALVTDEGSDSFDLLAPLYSKMRGALRRRRIARRPCRPCDAHSTAAHSQRDKGALMDNVVLVTFEDEGKAYEEFNRLKDNEATADFTILEMAVVKNVDGAIMVPDGYQDGYDETDNTAFGGVIGAVVGLLGGPVGVLLGAGIGLVAGMAMDDKDIDDDDSLMEYCASELTPGATALVMLAKEDNEDALDAQFDETCIIYRWDADEVNAEVERGEALRDSLAAETRKQLREARKEARKARREARKDK